MTNEQTYTRDHMEACACLWEAMLNADGSDPVITATFRNFGTVHMRLLAVDLSNLVLAVYETVTEDEREEIGPFDWEFVPGVLRQIDWVDGTPVYPKDPRDIANLILWRPAS